MRRASNLPWIVVAVVVVGAFFFLKGNKASANPYGSGTGQQIGSSITPTGQVQGNDEWANIIGAGTDLMGSVTNLISVIKTKP